MVPPLAGHVNPTIPLARELTDRGHTVAWTGHVDTVAELLPPSATFYPVADKVPEEVAQPGRGRRGPAGLKTTWEDYVVPVARQMVPGIHEAVDAFSPDVLVVDQQALGGAAVAEVRGLPWATSATTPAELVNRLGEGKVRQWLDGLLREFMVDAGVPAERAAGLDPRKSPYLLVAYTTRELVGISDFPDHYVLVGPSLGARVDTTPLPWEWLDQGSGPCVLVSLGTLVWRSGEKFFNVAAETFRGMEARAVFVAPPHLLTHAPPNVLVRERIPQLDLLPHVDAVVCHGGQNTVCESLACGLPLVVAPVHDDQPMIADQVANAGAGVRVKFFRLTPDMLRQAIEEVLTEPSYRTAADRLRSSFKAAGGAAAAADRLEGLLSGAAEVNKAELTSGPGQ